MYINDKTLTALFETAALAVRANENGRPGNGMDWNDVDATTEKAQQALADLFGIDLTSEVRARGDRLANQIYAFHDGTPDIGFDEAVSRQVPDILAPFANTAGTEFQVWCLIARGLSDAEILAAAGVETEEPEACEYEVTVTRDYCYSGTVRVRATSPSAAQALALNCAGDIDMKMKNAIDNSDEVVAVRPV